MVSGGVVTLSASAVPVLGSDFNRCYTGPFSKVDWACGGLLYLTE